METMRKGEKWKRTKRQKRRSAEGRGKEVKDVGQKRKPNNPGFSESKDTATILME
jgi:hypothetical protein